MGDENDIKVAEPKKEDSEEPKEEPKEQLSTNRSCIKSGFVLSFEMRAI